MGGATVYRTRVPIQDLLSLVLKERREAEKVNLYLKSIYCETISFTYYLYNVTLRFSK